MTELWQLTKLVRSKNAGPFELTFDIMFKDAAGFERVKNAGLLSAQLFSRMYGVPAEKVKLFILEPLLTIKVTIPRPIFSGELQDGDMYGGQFCGPLMKLALD